MKDKVIQIIVLSNGDIFEVGVPELSLVLNKQNVESKVQYIIENLNKEQRGVIRLDEDWDLAYKGNIYALSN